MYAHLEKATGRRGHSEDGPDPRVAGQPGLLGSVAFRQLAGAAGVCLTLWETEASATAYLGRRAGLAALPGEVYEVTAAEDGPASAQAPAWARLMYFDGTRAPEQAAAADRAGRQRIWPAISGLSGLTLTVKDTQCPVRLDVASFTIPADRQAAQVDLRATGRLDRRSAGVTAGPAFLIGRLVSLSLAVRLRRQAGPPQR